MDRYPGNYEAFKAAHEARIERVQASANAARTCRSGRPGLLARAARRLAWWPKPATSQPWPQTFFWS